MALETELVTLGMKIQRVHVMTITAPHVMHLHLGLGIRSVYVDLFENLPIRIVEPFVKQGRDHDIQHLMIVMVVITKLITPGMEGYSTMIQKPPTNKTVAVYRAWF
jgi:hypothetical protein